MRSNLAFWKQLQEGGYFENHPYYNGLVDTGSGDCSVIEWFLPLTKQMNAVVIGCGYGRESYHIARRVGRVYGIDVSRTILDKAVRYMGQRGVTNFIPVEAEAYRQAIDTNMCLGINYINKQEFSIFDSAMNKVLLSSAFCTCH